MAGLAYRICFGLAIAALLASFAMGVVAAGREGSRLPPLPSVDPFQAARAVDESGSSDAWVEQMRRYAEIQPRNSAAWLALGMARERRGESVPAIVACKRAVALGEPSGRCHRVLGRIYLEAGRGDLARFHLGRAAAMGLPLSPSLRAVVGDAEAS